MNKRFVLELAVGLILLAAVLFFGSKGMVAFALLAIHPFLGKRQKPDERELQLHYQIGNFTAGFTLLACVTVYLLNDYQIDAQPVSANWLFYVLSAFLISHGASGLVIMRD